MQTLDLFLPIADPAVEQLHESTALYTRDPVVDTLLDLAQWPASGGRLLDPGAGDGQFTTRVVERLVEHGLAADDVDTLVARVEAWEIHPLSVAECRRRVTRALVAGGWTRAVAEAGALQIVHEGDFLDPASAVGPADLAIGNPPYLTFANLPHRFKTQYRDWVPDHARRDLMLAFLDRCADVLTPDGRLGFVTADRWLFNQTAAKLRGLLGRRFGIAECFRLDSASAFFRPKNRRKGTPPRVHPVVVLLSPAADAVHPLTDAPFYPGAQDEEQPAGTVPLGSIASVRLAPWLGTHGVFTLDADRVPSGIPAEHLVPCVDTDDIDPDRDQLRAPTRVAIRTMRGVEPPPAIVAHLVANLGKQSERARQGKSFWMPAESWGPLPYPTEAILIPQIAPKLRTVPLPAGVLPINHQLTVVTTTEFPGGLAALRAAITAPAAQRWLADRAKRIDGGYLQMETSLLRRLPIAVPASVLAPDQAATAVAA